MRQKGAEYSFWLAARSKSYIWTGEAILEAQQGDELEYGMSLQIPPVMKLDDAKEQAPAVYDEIDKVRSGAALLTLIERQLQTIADPEIFSQRWPDGLSVYMSLKPKRLQLLALRLAALGSSYPKTMAAVSIMVYAVRGLASDREKANPVEEDKCAWCPLTALPPSKYCETHQISREQRRDRIKKNKNNKNKDNLDVVRRHASRISKIADDLWKNKQGIYNKLYQQLVGMTGALNVFPPPLERLQDDDFSTGARIGTNGGEWFIYLWKVLPRVQKVLGVDWPELVRSALEWKEWSRVLQRLGRIDSNKLATDAFEWAWTLIEAEAWAEAEEIERQQRCRGHPPKSEPDPDVEYALAQVRDGQNIVKVAKDLGVPRSTLYRWKARADQSTTSIVASGFQQVGSDGTSLVAK